MRPASLILVFAFVLTACGGGDADPEMQAPPSDMHTEAFAAHHADGDVHHDSLHADHHAEAHTAAHEAHHAAMHGDSMHHDGMHSDTMMNGEAAETVRAEMQDGVQRLSIEARTTGYDPARIELTEGVPAQITFTRTTRSPCMEQVRIPEFGVAPTDLPLNEPVTVEFTPDVSGTYTFVCGMDMQTGTMMVSS